MSSDVSDQTLALMRRMPTDRVSVLVVGDQGVGKTSLVRCLCSEVDGKANSIGLAPVRVARGSCHSCTPRWELCAPPSLSNILVAPGR